MQLILAGITLWFWSSAFLIFIFGLVLWLVKKFPPLSQFDGAIWAKLTALGLLLPPSFGVFFAISGLTSALNCPATNLQDFRLCSHSILHFCSHSKTANIEKSQFAFWGVLVWCSLVSATFPLLTFRRRPVKRIEPSPKLQQAIAKANLPSNLAVWETDDEYPAGLVGIISPSIFVSQSLIQKLPLSALTAVLRHEYAHFVRRDHFLRLIIFATALIFAPIPFALWLQKEWRNASERASDDFAANNRSSARHLSVALKSLQRFWVSKSPEQLGVRVRRLNSRRRKNAKESLLSAVSFILGLSFCIFVVSLPFFRLTVHCFAEALILR